jgi:vacuolar-type H+-ATPase subunit C/Vma6
MSTISNPREQLRALVDELPDELLPDAISALTHLEDEEPLSAQESEDVQSALDDIKHGRMISLADYEKQRGL